MAGPFQDKVDKARQKLHGYMHIDALYYAAPSGGDIPFIRQITCRVHDKFLRVGDLAGTNFHYAEIEENSPRAIFMRAEIDKPKRGYILATLRGYYRIDSIQPPDGITVTANLVRLTNEADTEGLIPLDGTVYAYGEVTLPGFR